jgi:hypothetical protein
MNDHLNPVMQSILNHTTGVKRHRIWFKYNGLTLTTDVICFPGEEESRGRAIIAARHDIPPDRLKFMKVDDENG